MILNAKQNQFAIYFSSNFFYPEIIDKWTPIVARLKLPFDTLEDFINSCVQSVSFPGINLQTVEQQDGQYRNTWRGGKELEPIIDKTLNINFKLSEGFLSYWIFWQQIDLYLRYGESKPWFPPLHISFLDHHGFELINYTFERITPLTLSSFDANYAQVAADFQTFSLSLKYNRFKVKDSISNITI